MDVTVKIGGTEKVGTMLSDQSSGLKLLPGPPPARTF
jgi:hypothetical protein